MHRVRWRQVSAFEGRRCRYYTYAAESDYTAAMLAEDLLEAGIAVREVEYEEEADVGMKYYGGKMSAEAFLREYDALRTMGMGGMTYDMKCDWNGVGFNVGMADDACGRSSRQIVFTWVPSEQAMGRILAALGK